MTTSLFGRLREFFLSLFRGRSAPAVEEVLAALSTPVLLTRPFTLVDDCHLDDPLLKEIMERDLHGMKTPLELMKHYAEQLNREKSYGEIDDKLNRLFLCGRTPESLDGYYHGITLGLKSGSDAFRVLNGIRERLGLGEKPDLLQIFYGRLLSETSPWAGKNFKRLGAERLRTLTGGAEEGEAWLGINSFRKAHKDLVNNLAGRVLSLVMELEEQPRPQRRQRSWIHAKGGLFVAKRQRSVAPEHPDKEVLALNYRWESLENGPPNNLLIDELVQIADGLYLGKLFYATALEYLAREYDPQVPIHDYKYRNFGYFLLMDDSWLHEKNVLFPELAYELADDLPEKFAGHRLKDADECRGLVSSMKLGAERSLLHYLQDLSHGVGKGKETEEAYFAKLQQLFLCGRSPERIGGFLHGGVVAFRSSGFFECFPGNILNDLWPAVRPFSPWSGKIFYHSNLAGISKYIGEDARHYRLFDHIILGCNTYEKELGLSLPATAFIERLGKIGMAVEYPEPAERDEDVHVKSFYFVATRVPSIGPHSRGKEVLQFNYRWPGFHTMPPDHLCMDELVEIADGLYLGQLLYATVSDLKYDPDMDPEVYQYENFGYFLLMDDEWHALKEFLAFDTE